MNNNQLNYFPGHDRVFWRRQHFQKSSPCTSTTRLSLEVAYNYKFTSIHKESTQLLCTWARLGTAFSGLRSRTIARFPSIFWYRISASPHAHLISTSARRRTGRIVAPFVKSAINYRTQKLKLISYKLYCTHLQCKFILDNFTIFVKSNSQEARLLNLSRLENISKYLLYM